MKPLCACCIHSQACELFILDLTLRAWMHAEENKRRTLQRNDIAAAISKTEIFDFLVSTGADGMTSSHLVSPFQ